ncbi:hypothetical protein R5R35_002912 [Gryllus longicercus]
MKYFTC